MSRAAEMSGGGDGSVAGIGEATIKSMKSRGRDSKGAGSGEAAVKSIASTTIGALTSDVRMAVETKEVEVELTEKVKEMSDHLLHPCPRGRRHVAEIAGKQP
jgi:hypothetical protein